MNERNRERWPITGYPNYDVTSDGEVIRKAGKTTMLIRGKFYIKQVTEKVLKPQTVNKIGHLAVTLYNEFGKKQEYVHRLVCKTFNGEPPKGKPYACHKDDDPTNNYASNLKWGSPQDNSDDRKNNNNNKIKLR